MTDTFRRNYTELTQPQKEAMVKTKDMASEQTDNSQDIQQETTHKDSHAVKTGKIQHTSQEPECDCHKPFTCEWIHRVYDSTETCKHCKKKNE